MIKVIKSFPPNYSQIVETLGDVSKSLPVFAYGEYIYNPFDREITKDVEEHEAVHLAQQAKFTSPDIWYSSYLTDKGFRLQQEIEAYGWQYAFGKERVKNNKLRDAFLDSLAVELSGEAYGKLLSFGEARIKINKYAKVCYD